MNVIIDDILEEWAFRSEDGLASGHNSLQNTRILKKILAERGIEKELMNEEPVIPLDSSEITVDIFDDMVNVKKLKPAYIDPLRSILIKFPEFETLYDKAPTLEKAIAVYNSDQYSNVIDAINRGVSDRTLGPGEVALVFLTKGCKSGGQKAGDLILSDGKIIDVKAHDSSNVVRIEYNSIKGFKKLDFQEAITQLVTFLRTENEAIDVLLSILNDDTYGVRPATPKEKIHTTNFLSELNSDEMGSSVFNGLELIGKRLNKIPSDKAVDTMDLMVNGEKMMLSVQDGKELIQKLKSNPHQKHYQLTLAPIEDKAQQVIIPLLKKLTYFSEGISLKTINKEVIDALHYDGVVIVNPNGKDAKYFSKEEMFSHLKFVRLSKGVKFEIIS
jgi:hypothetical protein